MLTTGFKKKRYSNLGLTSLSERWVVRAVVEGNCCWEMFGLNSFRGNSIPLPIGFDGSIQIQPKSIRREICKVTNWEEPLE
jgi:hypothetical protein